LDESEVVDVEQLGEAGTGCIPCPLQQLIRYYLGDNAYNSDGMPRRIAWDYYCWRRLHRVTERWFHSDPDDLDETLANAASRKRIRVDPHLCLD
jgi:hypothetical protein